MRAVIVVEPGGPEVLAVDDVAAPQPGPGDLLIAVTAAGVNRADLMQRAGHYPPPAGASPVLGLECCGTIAAVGEQLADWSVGERCVALLAGGGQAEFVAVPAGQVLPAPTSWSDEEAAGLIEVAATVLSNFQQANLAAGDSLLIHGGAGGIGSFAIQYAANIGAVVFATAGSPDKLDYCRELGATASFDYHQDWVAAVRAATDGRGVDVILDVVGAKYLESNVAALADDGRLMVIGLQGGRRATLDLGALLAKRGTIAATALRSRPAAQKAAICADLARLVWPLLEQGRIRPARTTVLELADVAKAHRLLESGSNIGKIVLRV